MVAHIRNALVSLHSHPTDDGVEHFLCSGVLIASGVVLTVGHVFDDFAPECLWVRPQVNRSPAVPIHGEVHRHSTLDAAWFQLESHPEHAEPLLIDGYSSLRSGVDHSLYAYFENALHNALTRRVVTFDAQRSWYTTEPLHQRGMSGGALCHDGALWGLLFARYTDISDNRGCVLGMHQLWDGFLENVSGIRRRGDAPQGAGSTTAPMVTHAAASATAAVATHAAEIDALRRIVRALFSAPPLRDWDWVRPLDDSIPRRLHEILGATGRDRGEQVVDWVVALTDAINDAVKYQRLSLVAPTQEFVHERLLQAMGKAARLCLDPAQLAGLRALQQWLEVPAATPEGALVAVRSEPHHGWQAVRGEQDAPTVNDRYACSFVEGGVGDDANYVLLSAIVSLRSRENPTGERIELKEADHARCRRWRQFLTDEHKRGRGRCLVVGDAYRGALAPGTVAFLGGFGVAVVVLLGGGDSLFLLDEDLLLGRIQGFLHSFEDFGHWKTKNDS